jgi:hypothetical protein
MRGLKQILGFKYYFEKVFLEKKTEGAKGGDLLTVIISTGNHKMPSLTTKIYKLEFIFRQICPSPTLNETASRVYLLVYNHKMFSIVDKSTFTQWG